MANISRKMPHSDRKVIAVILDRALDRLYPLDAKRRDDMYELIEVWVRGNASTLNEAEWEEFHQFALEALELE